jgi:DNA-3-methyladenine glycosylase
MSPNLPRSFYARDTRAVARDLLGARLVRLLPDGTRLSGMIVETEAYRPGDRASHAYRGQTERNAAMFQQPGTAYVYFTYGMYYCLNLVTEAVGTPSAVLIRALEPLEGIATLQTLRASHSRSASPIPLRDLCRGPARLCLALDVDKRFNAYDTLRSDSELFVEHGSPIADSQVSTSPRVGVFGDTTALNIEWRWFISANTFVSHPSHTQPKPSRRSGSHSKG